MARPGRGLAGERARHRQPARRRAAPSARSARARRLDGRGVRRAAAVPTPGRRADRARLALRGVEGCRRAGGAAGRPDRSRRRRRARLPARGPGARRAVCGRLLDAAARGAGARRRRTLRVGNLDAERDIGDVRDVVRRTAAARPERAGGRLQRRDRATPRDRRRRRHPRRARAVPVEVEPDPARMRPADLPVIAGDPAPPERARRAGSRRSRSSKRSPTRSRPREQPSRRQDCER